MEFNVIFYETESGQCPVREFLDNLKKANPDDFAVVMAGLAKLRNRQYHRPPLSKSIGGDLFELRHVGKLNTRVFYFFAKGQRIIAVHGIRNKAAGIPERDRNVALKRKGEWMVRNTQ